MRPTRQIVTWLLVWVSLAVVGPIAWAAEKGRVDVILWFDTEDYLLPASDDAVKHLAELLSQRNVRATFKMVGEKARVLEKRGRTDVIAALRKHDIGYHTDFHSVHPTPAEYLADCGLLDGVAEFLRREKRGAVDVRRIFGLQTLSCYGQPGSSWASQAMVALPEMDVQPVYVDDGSQVGLRGKPFWYAGVLNAYNLDGNVTRMDLHDDKAVEPAKKRVMQIAQRLAGEGGGLISIYYHPCEWVHKQFWDGVNFSHGANPPREEWKLPPQRPAEQTEQAFARFEQYVDYIKSLDVRFVTASELPALYADRVRSQGVTEDELLGMAAKLCDEKAAGVDYQLLPGKAVSPADQMELLAGVVGDLIEGKAVKYPRTTRGVLGPDAAPPAARETARTIAWPAFRDATLDVRDFLRTQGRVPARVFLGADSVPPADFLAGLAAAYCRHHETGKLPVEGVRLGKSLAVLPERHVAKDPAGLFGWVIHKPGFRPVKILEVARLQAWSFKPAVQSNAAAPQATGAAQVGSR